MLFATALLPLLGLAVASPSGLHVRRSHGTKVISNKLIFNPPSNYTDPRVLYARTAELSDGTLLATWENYSPEPPLVYFPIYKSTDKGETWKPFSKIVDQVNNWGLRYQPFLYELPEAFGGFAKGTVLAAGNSIPTDLNKTQIDVYASTDKGATWKFVSHVASGGRAVPDNGLTPVWEPFLMMYQKQLVLYYSDQRDPKYAQKLVHQTTTDLKDWGSVIDDVTYSNYSARPGMTTVTQLPDGRYGMTYELCGTDDCNVHIKLNADPLKFESVTGVQVTSGKTIPSSSPYLTWSSVGGKNGSLIMNSGSQGSIFINQALGAAGHWVEYPTPQPAAYTRHLRVLACNPSSLLIMGAGHLPPSTTNNVSLSVVDLKSLLKLS